MFFDDAELTGGAGGSAGPSRADGGDSIFDSSGWNVNFSSGSIEARKGEQLGQYMPYLVIGAGLLIVWRITRKR